MDVGKSKVKPKIISKAAKKEARREARIGKLTQLTSRQINTPPAKIGLDSSPVSPKSPTSPRLPSGFQEMVERVISQLKQKVTKYENRVKELESTLILEREQYELRIDNKDAEIIKLQQHIQKITDDNNKLMEKTISKFHRQMEMYNQFVDMTLRTSKLLS